MKKVLRSIITKLFPSPYGNKYLESIPMAPEPGHINIFSLYDYQTTKGKKIIYDIKKNRDLDRDLHIAKALYEHIHEYISEQQQFSYFLHPIITYIPITKKQKSIRGFNQVERIANILSEYYQGTCLALAYKNKETKKQALIQNKKDRYKNTDGCFSINPKAKKSIINADIIITDDLLTTGATLKEMEKILYKHGARNVISVTIAH